MQGLSTAILEPQPSIYQFLENSINSETALVMPDMPSIEYSDLSNEILTKFGLTEVLGPQDVTNYSSIDLIVLGNAQENSLTKRLLGEEYLGGEFDEAYILLSKELIGNVLFIIGRNVSATQSAVNFILNYKNYMNKFLDVMAFITEGELRVLDSIRCNFKTDDGNIFIKGTLEPLGFDDECITEYILSEYYCVNGEIRNELYGCHCLNKTDACSISDRYDINQDLEVNNNDVVPLIALYLEEKDYNFQTVNIAMVFDALLTIFQ